mgnify:CR=1 FL=1
MFSDTHGTGTVAELPLKHFMSPRLTIPGVQSRQFSLGLVADNNQVFQEYMIYE